MDQVAILAAGKGKRMGLDFPKVLQEINGTPIIVNLLEKIKGLGLDTTIIVGFKGEELIKRCGDDYHYVWQKEQLGTGHAVACAMKELETKELDSLVVLPGDHPLVSANTVEKLIFVKKAEQAVVSVATIKVLDFEGDNNCFYNNGRIVRDGRGNLKEIVELKDANEEQKNIKELNVSYYCFDAAWLKRNIKGLLTDNAAKEYYLTDMIKIAVESREKVSSFLIENVAEGMGVNTPEQLEIVKRQLI